ncbi:MAG: ABC transporter substrate-binding protein [Actinomycetota bacterium]|nr:ABC transporter substrate-binding protein [Actinomycetota bacterium]
MKSGRSGKVLGAGLVALVVTLAPFAFLSANASSSTRQSTEVPVDRQGYVVNAPADPYQNDDTAIHVGITGGREFARAFAHIALDYLPKDALVASGSIRLQVVTAGDASTNGPSQTYNLNNDSPDVAMAACVLTTPLPADIDAEHQAPEAACTKGSSLGLVEKDAEGKPVAWTFDLRGLFRGWSVVGNTGAAIVPINYGPASNWSVGFSTGYSTAQISYVLPPVPPPSPGKKPAPTYYRIPNPISPVVTVPTAAPVPSAAPQPQPSFAPGEPRTVRQGRSTTWMWVLPACVAVAAALMALGHQRGLKKAGVPLPKRLRIDWHAHPRAYALASVFTVWGLLFTSYSVTIAPPTLQVAGPFTRVDNPAARVPGATGRAVPAAGKTIGPGYAIVRGKTQGVKPGSEFEGPGTYKTIGTTRVFFPADGSPPAADLYHGNDDITGINFQTKTITLCGHAALTFGPAFNIGAEDLNVFWSYLNAHGGIDGWKFNVAWKDDGYDPGKAVAAAQACMDSGAFEILGGIGFDQIPAVRSWAESHSQLYVHHIVTTAGSQGRRYSFTALPSEEQMGAWAGQYAVKHFSGKRVGILWRESPNWQSGHDLFKKVVHDCSCMTIVGDYPVAKNQGSYTSELTTLKNTDRADVVFAWENALATIEMIDQAQKQDFHPDWIVFPFNLELFSLDSPQGSFTDGPKLHGVAAWDAYVPHYYGDGFASYKSAMQEFEEQYAWAKNNGPTNAEGNDLLFLAWEGFAGLRDFFKMCLPECTRNRMAGIMLTYHKKLPEYCDVDFTRLDGHHAGWKANVFETFRAEDGHLAWRPDERCVEAI